MSDPKKLLVITSVTSEDVAIQLAQELLENYVAACINIVPKVRSIYRWKGNITDDHESICIIKTREDKFDEVKKIIELVSGYDIPEVLAFEIKDGAEQFLTWVDANLSVPDEAEIS